MALVHEFFILPLYITDNIIKSKITQLEIDQFYLDNQYSSVWIHDKYILPYLNYFTDISTKDVWDDRIILRRGLNYYGFTIIMPDNLSQFIEIVKKIPQSDKFKYLIALCAKAKVQGAAILHVGI